MHEKSMSWVWRRAFVLCVTAALCLPLVTSATTCPNLYRNISFGSRGNDIVQLQQFLISQNLLAVGNNTGYFGRLTEAAVKKFQCRENIVCRGTPSTTGYGAVGPRTRTAITALCRTSTLTPPIRPPGEIAPPVGTVPPNSPLIPQSCTPLVPQTQMLPCPTGQTGSIMQTRASSCASGANLPTWSAWITTANTCTAIFSRPPLQFPRSFQVLINTNQLKLNEAVQASRFAADGVWSIPFNSGVWPWSLSFNSGDERIDWPQTLALLNASTWSVSEDNPGPPDDPDPNKNGTSQVDFVSSSMHRLVDGAMFYIEDGVATPIDGAQIATYSNHNIPGYGQLGPRVIVMTRSYAIGDPRRVELNRALSNPNVAGATLEFSPDAIDANRKFDEACKYILGLGKKCYLLLSPTPGTNDFLTDVQWATYYFQQHGLLGNPNVYFVLATYLRTDNDIRYVSSGSGDRNNIEAAVRWLDNYRRGTAIMPSFPPLSTNNASTKPRGWLDSVQNCDNIFGWSQDEDTPVNSTPVHIYIDGSIASANLRANQYREDLCSAIGSCYHGFSWRVPLQFRDGASHILQTFGIDSTILDTNNSELSGSPKTFQCSQ